jgi:hypothetical protein
MMSRFQRLLRTAKHMFAPYQPPKRPTFIADELLELRRAAARDLMGDVQVKPVLGRPIDYDKDSLPNG